MGGLVTLRETWSGQNDSFAKSFISAYTKSAGDVPLSIGEIHANAKTSSKNTNDLAFILMADPPSPYQASGGHSAFCRH